HTNADARKWRRLLAHRSPVGILVVLSAALGCARDLDWPVYWPHNRRISSSHHVAWEKAVYTGLGALGSGLSRGSLQPASQLRIMQPHDQPTDRPPIWTS